MEIIAVSAANASIYANLVQCYECEFAAVTGKKPDPAGRFELDTYLGGDASGYLLSVGGTLAGIAAVSATTEGYEVCEFFVVPVVRGRGVGRRFSRLLW